MRVRIWGNLRTTSNLNCLFSMHNWKWMNLSKMAGLNISSRQSSNLAQLKLMSRSVFPLPFVFPTLYSFLHRQRNKQNYSTQISRMLFTFLEEKLFEKNFSHCMSAKLQAPINGRNFGTKLTHLCGFWLDVSFFSQVKKTSLRFLLDVSFFFHMWKPSLLLWLARTHLHMQIYDIAFWWVFLSMYCT